MKQVWYFLGRHEYAIDDRGRIPVPPRYRDAFSHGAVISLASPEPCLRLYTDKSFEWQAKLHTDTPGTQRAGRIARRAFFSRSFLVELDRQGRILISGHLRTYASLDGIVIVVGAGEWLEIWDPARFSAEMSLIDDELESALDEVGRTVRPGT